MICGRSSVVVHRMFVTARQRHLIQMFIAFFFFEWVVCCVVLTMWHVARHMIYIDFGFGFVYWQCSVISATVHMKCGITASRFCRWRYTIFFPLFLGRREGGEAIFRWLGTRCVDFVLPLDNGDKFLHKFFAMTVDDRSIDAFNFRIDFNANGEILRPQHMDSNSSSANNNGNQLNEITKIVLSMPTTCMRCVVIGDDFYASERTSDAHSHNCMQSQSSQSHK